MLNFEDQDLTHYEFKREFLSSYKDIFDVDDDEAEQKFDSIDMDIEEAIAAGLEGDDLAQAVFDGEEDTILQQFQEESEIEEDESSDEEEGE